VAESMYRNKYEKQGRVNIATSSLGVGCGFFETLTGAVSGLSIISNPVLR